MFLRKWTMWAMKWTETEIWAGEFFRWIIYLWNSEVNFILGVKVHVLILNPSFGIHQLILLQGRFFPSKNQSIIRETKIDYIFKKQLSIIKFFIAPPLGISMKRLASEKSFGFTFAGKFSLGWLKCFDSGCIINPVHS